MNSLRNIVHSQFNKIFTFAKIVIKILILIVTLGNLQVWIALCHSVWSRTTLPFFEKFWAIHRNQNGPARFVCTFKWNCNVRRQTYVILMVYSFRLDWYQQRSLFSPTLHSCVAQSVSWPTTVCWELLIKSSLWWTKLQKPHTLSRWALKNVQWLSLYLICLSLV